MINAIDNFFRITDRGSNMRTEILAGLTTYLSLAYIFIVNPAILHNAGLQYDGKGMDVSGIFFATICASVFTTLLMGFWARLPFAVAPGLEMNGFFAFTVCGTLGLSWQSALGAVFWSGILCIIITSIPARQKIVDSIPNNLKTNIAVSVGVFVFTTGLFLGKIAIFDKGIPKGIGSLTSSYAIALYIGLLVSYVLGMRRLRFPGGMLVAIIIAAVYCKAQGIVTATPAARREDMTSLVGKLDLISLFTDPKLLPVFLILFVIGFYGSIGKFIGLTTSTNLQKDGKLDGMKSAMYTQGIGTVTSGLLGTSSIITYVESAVGIATGGRTGLVSVVVGILMLCSLVFTPLVGLIPVEATSGVLCYVGFILLPHDRWRDSSGTYNTFDACVAVVMGLIALVFFNLIWAMTFGFIAYTIKQILSADQKNPFLISSTIVLIFSTILQEYIK